MAGVAQRMHQAAAGADRPRWAAAVLAAIIVAELAHIAVYLAYDTRPPYYDPAVHARLAHTYAGQLRSVTGLGKWFSSSSFYPPLMHWTTAPLFAAGLRTGDWAVVSLFPYVAAALAGTYWLGSAAAGWRAGLIAAFLLAAYPGFHAYARWYLQEVPLLAAVALTAAGLLANRGLQRRRSGILIGAIAGLGMLIRWTYIFFIPAPLLIWGLLPARDPAARRTVRRSLAAAALTAFVIAAPWYLSSPRSLVRNILGSNARAIKSEGDPHGWTLDSLLYAPRALADPLLYLPFTVIAAAGTVQVLRRRQRAGIEVLLISALTLALLAVPAAKDPRYVAPCLPYVAVLSANLFLSSARQRVRWLLFAPVPVLAALHAAAISFGAGPAAPDREWLGFRVTGSAVHAVTPASREHWPVEEVLDALLTRPSAATVRLGVLANVGHFEADVLLVRLLERGQKLTVFDLARDKNPAEDFPACTDLLVIAGHSGPFIDDAFCSRITAAAVADPPLLEGWRVAATWPLPCGGTARLLSQAGG